MQRIKIACTSGLSLPLDEICIFSSRLKKHSQLEIERLCDSIVNDGFLFPLAIGKLSDKNYVIDGECRYCALRELEYRGFEIPDVPIFYVRTSQKTIKRNILIATSTNHCVTKNSLIDFVAEDNIDLKQFSFNEGERIDLHSVADIERYFEIVKSSDKKILARKEDYFSLLKNGEI